MRPWAHLRIKLPQRASDLGAKEIVGAFDISPMMPPRYFYLAGTGFSAGESLTGG
jgi:hypothetical protein